MATIVVLNGTSSSGKTSIARAFQELAPRVFLNFSIDSILYALPPSLVAQLERGEAAAPRELIPAFYACVRELAALGHDLVIDHAITSRAEADMLATAVQSHRALLVAIDCPVDVLIEREQARGNRRLGMAEAQSTRVHQWLEYDLRIDSSQMSVEEAARKIVELL
jgi:chloramphenicol 3-O phosphotransferase